MAGAPINEVLNNALKDAVDSWKQEGLSDEEILAKIDKIDFKDVMMSITDTAATDFADFFRERMYEIELEERAKTQEFSAHQEQLWGKCCGFTNYVYAHYRSSGKHIQIHRGKCQRRG